MLCLQEESSLEAEKIEFDFRRILSVVILWHHIFIIVLQT